MDQIDQALITRENVIYFLNEDFKSRALPAGYLERKGLLSGPIKSDSQDAENDQPDLFQLEEEEVYQASPKAMEPCNEGSDPVQQGADCLCINLLSPQQLVLLKGGYIEVMRMALELIVNCFKEFQYWGYETGDKEFDEFLTERLNTNLPELMPGYFLEKSMSANIIDSILINIMDESYLPDLDELNTMCQHLADFHHLLKLIIAQHAGNHQQLMEDNENYIYQEEDPQVLIEFAINIGRALINETIHPDFKKIKEHLGLQIEYLINSRSVSQALAMSLPPKGLEQLTTRLSLVQRSKLFDLLQQGKFLGNEKRDCFIWALGNSDEKMPPCWQPIQWKESKLSFRELLTPFLQTITNQQIRIIEKLFLDKHCNPLKMNKLPKVDEHSARCLDIEKIAKSLLG